jgi:hypothetical protein
MENVELKKAVAENDETWQKRMLLLILTTVIALLGLD